MYTFVNYLKINSFYILKSYNQANGLDILMSLHIE